MKNDKRYLAEKRNFRAIRNACFIILQSQREKKQEMNNKYRVENIRTKIVRIGNFIWTACSHPGLETS